MSNHSISIAYNTALDFLRQPFFFIVTGIGSLFLFLSFFFTMFAFGEEARLIKEMGFSTITICCLGLVSFSAANTISKEMENGTTITLLSKPVNKKHVILGKFLGVLSVTGIAFFIMGIFLIFSLCLKNAQGRHAGLFFSFVHLDYSVLILQFLFSFLQIAILNSIAIAGSIYLSFIANLCCCFCIYIAGNLAPLAQELFYRHEEGFSWFLAFFYIIFPNLEGLWFLGIKDPLASPPFLYILLMVTYVVCYIILVITLSFQLFENRECH